MKFYQSKKFSAKIRKNEYFFLRNVARLVARLSEVDGCPHWNEKHSLTSFCPIHVGSWNREAKNVRKQGGTSNKRGNMAHFSIFVVVQWLALARQNAFDAIVKLLRGNRHSSDLRSAAFHITPNYSFIGNIFLYTVGNKG